MARHSAVAEQTRENLRTAFWELYATRPIERISVREITDRAGYNRATFYLYYHDVYELLEESERYVLDRVELLVEGQLAKGGCLDFSEQMGLILRMAQESNSYTKVLLGDHGDPAFARRFKEVISPLLDRFVLPQEGLGEQERHVMREFYLSGLLAAMRTWLSEESPMPIDQLVNLITRTVL